MRYASCSCGWSGQLRTAPGAREQPLRTRRYRAQTREVLRPSGMPTSVSGSLSRCRPRTQPKTPPPPRRSRREHLSVHSDGGRASAPSRSSRRPRRKPRPSSSRTRRCPSPTPELV
ncbi:hypothetical protein Ae717Ps2_7324 [Pseudonocardia sp. Ae717_Ps2]|nr:hypothetical protein Ae717Ps2_7324 [Pseudonocardia sp. Ae717_Ps2]